MFEVKRFRFLTVSATNLPECFNMCGVCNAIRQSQKFYYTVSRGWLPFGVLSFTAIGKEYGIFSALWISRVAISVCWKKQHLCHHQFLAMKEMSHICLITWRNRFTSPWFSPLHSKEGEQHPLKSSEHTACMWNT